jgi:hypothetical protein
MFRVAGHALDGVTGHAPDAARWTPEQDALKVEPEPSPNSSAADVASPRNNARRATPPPRAQTPPPPPTNLPPSPIWCSASPTPRSPDAVPLVRPWPRPPTLPDLPLMPDLERKASGSFSDAGDDEAPPPTSRARARTVSDCRRPSVLTRELADLSVSTTRKRRRARSCDDDGCWGQFLELSGDENDHRPRKLTISPALKIGSWPPRAV